MKVLAPSTTNSSPSRTARVRSAPTSEPASGSVTPSDPMSPGQGGADEPVDQVGVPGGHDVRQRDGVGEQRREQSGGGTGLDHRLHRRDDVDEVAALPADLLGEADAQQPGGRGLAVQGAGSRPPPPTPPAPDDVPPHEPAADPRSASRSGVVHGSPTDPTVTGGLSGISSVRLSSHSPTALPCGSNLVLAATPRPSSPSITTFTARRFGSGCTVTGRSAASGSSSRTFPGVSVAASHAAAPSLRAQTPTFAVPPLSPPRARATAPSAARRRVR